jgi:uncharacterized membrane protein YqgA involved in biofilm formation
VFPGIGTVVNVAAVLVGTVVGALVGHRFEQRTRDVVTDGLGLVTLLIAASSAAAVNDHALTHAVGHSAPMLIVLGSVVLGGIIGSLIGIERGLEGFGGWLQEALTRRARRPHGADDFADDVDAGDADDTGDTGDPAVAARLRFIEGFVISSLVFCVGPLTILGSLNDGLGNGADQLYLKSALDGFAAIAFAASFGWGVGASVVSLVVVQGSLTALGVVLGGLLPDAEIAALTAVGGLVLVGVALRLLRLKQLPVGDLLPGLAVAPLLTALVVAVR